MLESFIFYERNDDRRALFYFYTIYYVLRKLSSVDQKYTACLTTNTSINE